MELEIRPIATQHQEMSLGADALRLVEPGSDRQGGEGPQLEMKLSNKHQIKATHIHEKSKCLSFCPKFLHFTLFTTLLRLLRKS